MGTRQTAFTLLQDELLQAAKVGDMHMLQRCLVAGLDANCKQFKVGVPVCMGCCQSVSIELLPVRVMGRAHSLQDVSR